MPDFAAQYMRARASHSGAVDHGRPSLREHRKDIAGASQRQVPNSVDGGVQRSYIGV